MEDYRFRGVPSESFFQHPDHEADVMRNCPYDGVPDTIKGGNSTHVERISHQDDVPHQLEFGPTPENSVEFIESLVDITGSDFLRTEFQSQKGIALAEAQYAQNSFREGVEESAGIAERLLKGERFRWWDLDAYRKATYGSFDITSSGQFITVMGPYALNRVGGRGPMMMANHGHLFPDSQNSFLDCLTNATVTNFGQGYPLQIVAANTMNRITGGSLCVPYHPGPLMEQAGNELLRVTPFASEGAKVAWFNSGGDAISIGIAAAEKYTTITHGENGRRSAVYFKEAYHGNIEGRAGRISGGINEGFHPDDRNAIQLEYPNFDEEVEPVLASLTEEVNKGHVSCIVMEPTQGDGGGVSMHGTFFVEMMKLSLDKQIPVVVDEIQSGFARSGRVFDIEYLLDVWKASDYVQKQGYPVKPPFILALAKSMTNGAVPGSAVVLPKEYAVLSRAQGLNTFSAHPSTLAATIATTSLMREDVLQMVRHKRRVFDDEIERFVNPNGFVRGVRGHGLHLFVDVADNQALQVELIGKRRILTGTVSRNGLRAHPPLNTPDVVIRAVARSIGEVSQDLENGKRSPQVEKILRSGISGLAER